MIDLTGVEKAAVLSPCGNFRYQLTRLWNRELPLACWICLNPSTADAAEDDASIRRMVGFARGWGCGGIDVRNLFALRATDPRQLRRVADPVGPDNDRWLSRLGEIKVQPGKVIAGWGIGGEYQNREQVVVALMAKLAVPLWCLGRTKAGRPRHPLFLASRTELEPF
jgi:hypothetical protein